jgi:hypothetical protein
MNVREATPSVKSLHQLNSGEGKPMKIFLLLLLLLLTLSCDINKEYRVTYDAVTPEARGSKINVTYRNADGGTEQAEVRTPWSKTFTTKSGSFLYLSAQNEGTSSALTVYISVNGETRKTATSTGNYVIASVDYRCCEPTK